MKAEEGSLPCSQQPSTGHCPEPVESNLNAYTHLSISQMFPITILYIFLLSCATCPANLILLVRFEVLTAVVMKSTIFWDITPCDPLSTDVSEEGACHLISSWFPAQLIFSTLMMEAICFSETSVDFQRTTRRHIPENGTLDSP
jgi:hypothetical protein